MADIAGLQQKLGISINDQSLLEQALVHRSFLNENPTVVTASNERLEFLGDAVLDWVVAEKLYRDFPQFSEGEMTRLRAALVRRDTLARIARNNGLGDFLYLGRGEKSGGGGDKPVNLAGVLEAVIAVVFLDQGDNVAREFILGLFAAEIDRVVHQGKRSDYKSQLQELIQARHQLTPTYHMVEAAGPAHDRRFVIEVRSGDTTLGTGSGKSKKVAETAAARDGLSRLSPSFTP